MTVGWVQAWSWGPIYNSGERQNYYFRVPVTGTPHIIATASLNVLSTIELDGVAGHALASFDRFEFLDDQGVTQETEVPSITSWVDVPRCVSITLAVGLRAAAACGQWSFYGLS